MKIQSSSLSLHFSAKQPAAVANSGSNVRDVSAHLQRMDVMPLEEVVGLAQRGIHVVRPQKSSMVSAIADLGYRGSKVTLATLVRHAGGGVYGTRVTMPGRQQIFITEFPTPAGAQQEQKIVRHSVLRGNTCVSFCRFVPSPKKGDAEAERVEQPMTAKQQEQVFCLIQLAEKAGMFDKSKA